MIVTRRRGLNAGADFQPCVCEYTRQTKHHYLCGCSSVVEQLVAIQQAESSNLFTRSFCSAVRLQITDEGRRSI